MTSVCGANKNRRKKRSEDDRNKSLSLYHEGGMSI
jgi:hypothetical protein